MIHCKLNYAHQKRQLLSQKKTPKNISCHRSTIDPPCDNFGNLNIELQQVRQTLKKVVDALDETCSELKHLRCQISTYNYSNGNLGVDYPEFLMKLCKVCFNSNNVGVYDTHICWTGVNSICFEYCSEAFKSITDLMNHSYIITHGGNHVHQWHECSVSFDMSILYTFHDEIVHSSSSTEKPQSIVGIDNKRELKCVSEVDPMVNQTRTDWF